MGIGRMLWRSTGLGRTIDTIRNIVEEDDIVEGIKRTAKEDWCEDNPIGNMIYQEGHYDGKKAGYVEASNEFEGKLLSQAEEFLKQKAIFENERDEYEKLLDEYDQEIDLLVEKTNRTIEENEYLTQLLLTERKLKKIEFFSNNLVSTEVHQELSSLSLDIETAEKLFIGYELEKAFKIIKMLAENGDGRAMFYMGQFYDMETNGPVKYDRNKSLNWYQAGMQAGDIFSTIYVKYRLDEPETISHEIVEKLSNLADSGHPVALFELSELYRDGYGVIKNNEKSKELLKKSCDAMYWYAQYKLIANEIEELEEAGVNLDENMPFSQLAVKYLNHIANLGVPEVQMILVYYHMLETGDEEKAIEWTEKAAKQGNVDAIEVIADMYAEGYGSIQADASKAFDWYMKAAKAGSSEAQYTIGECYYHGDMVEQSFEHAMNWYELAAKQGHMEAQYSLGYCHFHHFICPNFDDAKKWFGLAAKQGHEGALKEIKKNPTILDEDWGII